MPDRNGRFRGISVPKVPWQSPKVTEIKREDLAAELGYDPLPHSGAPGTVCAKCGKIRAPEDYPYVDQQDYCTSPFDCV